MARKPPTIAQAWLITLSGAALAFFGCLGAFAGTNLGTGETSVLGWLAAAVFILGALIMAGGIVAYMWPVVNRWVQPSPRHDSDEPPTGG